MTAPNGAAPVSIIALRLISIARAMKSDGSGMIDPHFLPVTAPLRRIGRQTVNESTLLCGTPQSFAQ